MQSKLLLAAVSGWLLCGAAEGAANDSFGLAGELGSAAAAAVPYDGRGATRQVGEPTHESDSSTGTLWWQWTAPANGNLWLRIRANGVDGSGVRALYTGTDLATLTKVAVSSSGTAKVFPVTEGTAYRLAVADNRAAALVLEFYPLPANDAFESRIALGSSPEFDVQGCTVGATLQPGEPSLSSQGPTIWWSWQAPVDGMVSFNLTETSGKSWNVGVYTGETLGTLSLRYLRPFNDAPGTLSQFRAKAGEPLAIVASGYGSSTVGCIGMHWQLTSMPYQPTAATALDLGSSATASGTADNRGGSPALWWRWTPPANGIFRWTVTRTDGGTTAPTVKAFDGNLTALPPHLLWQGYRCRAGQPVFLSLETSEYSTGTFAWQLSLLPAAANDDIANAAPLAMGETEFDLTYSGAEPDEPSLNGAPSKRSLWWDWTAPAAGALWYDQPTGSGRSAIWRLSPAGGVIQSYMLPQELLCLVEAGDSLRLGLLSNSDSTESIPGRFSAKFVPRSAGSDAFATAEDLGSPWSVSLLADPTGATREPGEPMLEIYGGSLWWKWTAPAACNVHVRNRTQSGSQFFGLWLYRGAEWGSLTAHSSPAMNAGETLWIAVTAPGTGSPVPLAFELSAAPAHPNDAFAGATDLGSVASWRSEFYLDATTEPGEPLGLPTLWWKWTAPEAANGYFEILGSGTRGFVYQGSTLADLTLVADSTNTGLARFVAEAGATYWLAVSASPTPGALCQTSLRLEEVPPGDWFAAPVELGSAASFTLSPLANSGIEPIEAGLFEAGYDQSLWWRWHAPADGKLVAKGLYAGSWKLFEETGGPGAGLTAVTDEQVLAGRTYRIANLNGPYKFTAPATWTFHARPLNDSHAGAQDLGGATALTTTADFYAATADATELALLSSASNPPTHGVWWRWTAPFDGTLKTQLKISGISVNYQSLTVLIGSDPLTWRQVADALSIGSTQAECETSVTAGTTYLILAAGRAYTADLATLTLSAWPGPANNDWVNAIDLGSGLTVTAVGSNIGATREAFEPANTAASVWWRWTAAAACNLVTSASIGATGVSPAIYQNNGGVLEPVTCSFNDSGTTCRVEAGREYWIAVRSSTAQGEVRLTLHAVEIPPNDDFANRIILPAALPASFAGTPAGATVEPGEMLYDNSTGTTRSASLWWSWTAPESGAVRLDLTGATYVYVQTGATVDALTTVLRCAAGSSAWTASAGETYHFVAFRTTGAGAAFAVQLSAMTLASNDAFATPLTLGSGTTGSWGFSTLLGTAETGEPAHGGQAAVRSLWFEWTAPAAGGYRFDAVAGGYQARLGIYQGSAVNALQMIASGTSRVGLIAVAGQTYRIAVDGASGSGTLKLQPQPLPANDQFANRTVLPVTLPPLRGTTMLASMETGEPGTFMPQPQRTLWWEWVAPVSTYLTINEVSGSNAGMDVYSSAAAATGFASLTFETSANYAGSLYVTAGRRYYFRVFTRNSSLPSGADFDFRLSGSPSVNPIQPPNDDFANRIDLGNAIGIKITGDNYGATRETWDPSSTATLWWTWTAPADGVFGVRRTGTAAVTLTIFTGQDPAALTTVAAGSGPVEWFRATAGTVYQIRSSTSSNNSLGATSSNRFFGLEMVAGAPPANDDFAAALVLPDPGTTGLDGTTAGASAQAGEPAHAGTTARASVWYQWTASLAGAVQLATSFATMRAGIYQGDSVETLAQVAAGNTPLTFTAVPGETYRIALDATGDESFVVRLNLPGPPVGPIANDAFAAAVELTGWAVETPGSTVGATMEPGEPYHNGNTSQPGSAWWRWTASANGAVAVAATGITIAIYQGTTLESLEPVARGDGAAVFQAVAGVSYHLAAAKTSSSGASFTLRLNQIPESPANDAFDNAEPLAAQASITGTLVGASREVGESWHGSTPLVETVWYRWTAPSAGRARATLLSGNPGALVVYRGLNLAALTEAAAGTTEAGFSVQPGETVWVVVGRSGSGAAGPFELGVGMIDTGGNDAFANRIDLGAVALAQWSGTAEEATMEAGETPTESGGNGSRWWKWTAPADGGASLQLNEGRVVPAAYVYTGSALGSLTLVASISGSPPRLAFPVRAGTTYQIALRGKPSAAGVGDYRVTLAWNPQPNDAPERAQELASALPISASSVQAGAPALWWQWVAPASGEMELDFRMTEFSCNPSVWSGPGLPLLDTVPLPWGPTDVYRFTAVAGARYWIRTVTQQSGYFGKVVFEIRPQTQLPNDLFADALPVAGERIVLDTVNFGAGTEPGEPLPISRPYSQTFTRSLWWLWVAPRTGLLRVKITSGWAFLYQGASWAELREVAGPGGATSTSGAYWVEAGRTYFLAAGNSASGQVAATLELSPPGDRFADAEDLGSGDWIRRAGSLAGCSWEPGEPLHAGSAALASRWFRWQAPATRSFRITAMNGSAKLRAAIYQGDAITRLSETASGLGTFTFTAEAGHTYQLAIDGGSQPGAYELVLEAEVPGYAAWRDSWAAATDPAAAPGADPDGDGRVNFLEFALGTQPLQFSAEPALTYDSDLGRVRLQVQRPVGREGIHYLIEVANALNDWLEPAPERRSEVVTDNGDGTETLSVTLLDYRYENHSELFFRLRVVAAQ